jgi:hypothetical protein
MISMSDSRASTRVRQKFNNASKNTKWTIEEDNQLLTLMQARPESTWSDCVPIFPGKTSQQVAERWEKVINPSLVKGSWTQEEDDVITSFVRDEGTKQWTKLASLLPGRIGKQCRERWRNHLDPEVNRSPWTDAEDRLLIELHEVMGNQWVKLTEYLPGRSDNAIKNRWNSTLQKNLEAIRTGTPRKRRGRKSRFDMPRSADDVPKPPRLDEIAVATPAKSAHLNLLSPLGTIKSPFPGFKSLFSPLSPDGEHLFGEVQSTDKDLFFPGSGNAPGPMHLFSPRDSTNADVFFM